MWIQLKQEKNDITFELCNEYNHDDVISEIQLLLSNL